MTVSLYLLFVLGHAKRTVDAVNNRLSLYMHSYNVGNYAHDEVLSFF